jgi:nitrogen fixation-related uncharacterized protein
MSTLAVLAFAAPITVVGVVFCLFWWAVRH